MSLWADKYRPRTIKDLGGTQAEAMGKLIERGEVPDLIFYGPPGTGKTSAVYVLLHELTESKDDYVFLNASAESGVEVIETKIKRFIGSRDPSKLSIVALDEADGLSSPAQRQLCFLMDQYSHTGTRFLFTCNDVGKLCDSLVQNYTVCIEWPPLEHAEMTRILAFIVKQEDVRMDNSTLQMLLQRTRGDLRQAVGMLQSLHLSLGPETHIRKHHVSEMFPATLQEDLLDLLDPEQTAAEAIVILDQLLSQGYEVSQVINEMFHILKQKSRNSAENLHHLYALCELHQSRHSRLQCIRFLINVKKPISL